MPHAESRKATSKGSLQATAARGMPACVRVSAALAGALVALALVFSDPRPSDAATTAPKPAGTQLYWGGIIDGPAYGVGYVPYDMRGVATFEAHAGGKGVSIVELGTRWQRNGQWKTFPAGDLDNIRNHGSIPLFTWQSTGDNPADFRNAIITSGSYDGYITQWATDAKTWGHPFFMRFDHESDGWWYPWGEGATSSGGPIVNGNQPGDYVRMYRHVHDIFTRVGVTNATWVWSVNYESTSNQYPPLSQIYPGPAYVDWTGIDPYNFYPDSWLTFNQALTGAGTTWISNTYQKVLAVAPSSPMMLAEFGSVEATTSGAASALSPTARPVAREMARARPQQVPGLRVPLPSMTASASRATVASPSPANTKPAWLRDALLTQLVYNFPAIKAVLYYNFATDHPTMPIESSTASQTAFAQGIASPLYATPNFASLATSPILPLTERVAYLAPVADTNTASETPSSSAAATAPFLTVSGNPAATRKAYLRFNLGSLQGTTIDQVVLQLTSTTAANAPSVDTFNVKYLSNNSWSEGTLNWQNASRLNAYPSPAGTLVSPSVAGTKYTVTLPPALVQSTLGTGKLSLQLDDSSSDDFLFASREVTDPTQRPQLIVAYR